MSRNPSARGVSANPARPQQKSRHDGRRPVVEPLESRCVMAAPTLGPLQNVTVQAGVPLNIALDGLDADGDAVGAFGIEHIHLFHTILSEIVMQILIEFAQSLLR